MPEFDYKPVQVYGKYITPRTPVSNGDTAIMSVDEDGKVDTNLYRRTSSTALFSSSVFTTADIPVSSGSVDVSEYRTKTVLTLIQGSAGTLLIHLDLTDTGESFHPFTSTQVLSGTVNATTLTDAVGLMRVQVQVASSSGTVDTHLKLQS